MDGEELRGQIADLEAGLDEIGRTLGALPSSSRFARFRDEALSRCRRLEGKTLGVRKRVPQAGSKDLHIRAPFRELERLQRDIGQLESYFLPPLMRDSFAVPIVISYLEAAHASHESTASLPFALEPGAMQVTQSYDDLAMPPIYRLPVAHRKVELHRHLLLHEYGHVLHARLIGDPDRPPSAPPRPLTPEADELVHRTSDMVRTLAGATLVDRLLCPQEDWKRDDARCRKGWSSWLMEFYCDAVGLKLGTGEFHRAIRRYLAPEAANDRREKRDRSRYTHPAALLRLQVLSELSTQWRLPPFAPPDPEMAPHEVVSQLAGGVARLIANSDIRQDGSQPVPVSVHVMPRDESWFSRFWRKLMPKPKR